ncbi:MAG: histidine triad nucleotide-binding protein [Spirochaetota bacterium]|nr:histidine triad nucleotide-binding protein [Spirochaetota bacterium]
MCIFCRIIKDEKETNFIYQDKDIVAFRDINPAAPVHILIVPRKHIESINHLEKKDKSLIGKMFLIAKQIAKEQNVAEKGYKLIFNVGRGGGQIIDHVHLHLLSGRIGKMP